MKSSQTLELLSAEIPQRFQPDSSCRRVNLSSTSPTINLHFCFLCSINVNNIQDIPLPKEVKSSANTMFNSRKKKKTTQKQRMTATEEKQYKNPVEEIWGGGTKLKIFFFPNDIVIIIIFWAAFLPLLFLVAPPPPLLLFFHSEKGRPSVDINRA